MPGLWGSRPFGSPAHAQRARLWSPLRASTTLYPALCSCTQVPAVLNAAPRALTISHMAPHISPFIVPPQSPGPPGQSCLKKGSVGLHGPTNSPDTLCTQPRAASCSLSNRTPPSPSPLSRELPPSPELSPQAPHQVSKVLPTITIPMPPSLTALHTPQHSTPRAALILPHTPANARMCMHTHTETHTDTTFHPPEHCTQPGHTLGV